MFRHKVHLLDLRSLVLLGSFGPGVDYRFVLEVLCVAAGSDPVAHGSFTAGVVVNGVCDWEDLEDELVVLVVADRVDLIRLLIHNPVVERN